MWSMSVAEKELILVGLRIAGRKPLEKCVRESDRVTMMWTKFEVGCCMIIGSPTGKGRLDSYL